MASDQELSRNLGFLEAYTIGLGTMIGAGIFVLPSIAAESAGPASMISFLIGGIVSLLAALSLSELATGMPRAGGSYYYINRALGSFFGSIVGWGMWSGLTFATAFYMLGFAQYMTYFYGDLPIQITALAMSAFLVALNYRGTKESATFQNLIVILLVAFILIFMSTCIFQVDMNTLSPFNPKGWGAVAMTAATVYVTFIGFEVIATSAEEIKNPGRNLPLSMIASVLTPTLLYVLVMFVLTGLIPVPDLAVSNIPVADAAEIVLGPLGALMMVVGAVMATVSSANASILSAARVNFAMGRDRILSDWLNEVHEEYRTPYRSIIVTGIIILALIGLGTGLELLADVASFTYLVTYSLVHVAVIVMRRADPSDYEPDFALPYIAYPLVPITGLLVTVLIITQMKPLVIGIGTGIMGMAVLWYLFYARGQAADQHLVGEAILKPHEQHRREQKSGYRIVVPIANPRTEQHLLRLAAASAQNHDNAELVVINIVEVPDQTALAQDLEFEEKRIQVQQDLLDVARDFAKEQNIGLRTRAILSRDIGESILDVLDDEEADQILMGWKGDRTARDNILGSNIDRVVDSAPCEVTLVKSKRTEIRDVAAFVGTGGHAALAARRAHEFVRGTPGGTLTLVHVDDPTREEPKDVIDEVSSKISLDREEFNKRVITSENVEEALLKESQNYDTICIGATETGPFQRALFGSLPETLAIKSNATVAMIRKEPSTPRSISRAFKKRFPFLDGN